MLRINSHFELHITELTSSISTRHTIYINFFFRFPPSGWFPKFPLGIVLFSGRCYKFIRKLKRIRIFQAHHWLLDYYYTESKPENVLDLETRTVGLKFQAEDSHFRKDKTLLLTCSATVADRTRSSKIKAYLSTITKEKFAQPYGNYCGKDFLTFQNYFVLSPLCMLALVLNV